MIKFFRRVRQQMLFKNKFSQYFLYAIGEIVLVVIGILIALGINNKNEDIKTQNTATAYLNSLHEEFQFNLTLLDSTINIASRTSKGIENILTLFNPSLLDTVSEIKITQALQRLDGVAVYSPSNGALSEIISSGNLKILKNNILKQRLAGFEKRTERIRIQEEQVLEQRGNIIDFARESGTTSTMLFLNVVYAEEVKKRYSWKFSNKDLFKSEHFFNTIVYFNAIQMGTLAVYEILRQEIEEIITLIEDEMIVKL